VRTTSNCSPAQAEKVVGESSVYYLYSTSSAQGIREYEPDARIVIMLRNPVDMLYPYHGQLVFNGDEPIEDLRFRQYNASKQPRSKAFRNFLKRPPLWVAAITGALPREFRPKGLGVDRAELPLPASPATPRATTGRTQAAFRA